MKRRELIRHLEAHGCPLKREGGSHSIHWNPTTGRREPVPRHAEIPDQLAKKILPRTGNPGAMKKRRRNRPPAGRSEPFDKSRDPYCIYFTYRVETSLSVTRRCR